MATPGPTAMTDYERIEACIHFLERHRLDQPDLPQMARHAGLSEYHLQRLFSRWAGISPKSFLKFLTLEHAKGSLARSRSVLDAALDAGLSGPGRLHDLFISVEGVTPGEFKTGGAGLTIFHGVHPTPFGACFLAATNRGVCALSFLDAGGGRAEALRNLRQRWPGAKLVEDLPRTRTFAQRAFEGKRRAPGSSEQGLVGGRGRTAAGHGARKKGSAAGSVSGSISGSVSPLRVLLAGTPFQIKVWEALLRIPAGGMVSYQDLARLAGAPRSARAVGRALSENPVAYLIPCHRVIRASGIVDGYRWGTVRKRSMLAWEAAGESTQARETEPTGDEARRDSAAERRAGVPGRDRAVEQKAQLLANEGTSSDRQGSRHGDGHVAGPISRATVRLSEGRVPRARSYSARAAAGAADRLLEKVRGSGDVAQAQRTSKAGA